jgi:hypothetical protein
VVLSDAVCGLTTADIFEKGYKLLGTIEPPDDDCECSGQGLSLGEILRKKGAQRRIKGKEPLIEDSGRQSYHRFHLLEAALNQLNVPGCHVEEPAV